MNEKKWLVCNTKGCRKRIHNDSFDKKMAYDKGWYLSSVGYVYCPDHVPEWFEEWRNKKLGLTNEQEI